MIGKFANFEMIRLHQIISNALIFYLNYSQQHQDSKGNIRGALGTFFEFGYARASLPTIIQNEDLQLVALNFYLYQKLVNQIRSEYSSTPRIIDWFYCGWGHVHMHKSHATRVAI